MKYFLSIAIVLFGLTACKKTVSSEEQANIDEGIIQQYIADNNLNAESTGSGLYYVVNTQGTGASCTTNSDVRVAYKGYFTSGEVFDESTTSGIEFNLQNVIAGWTEGIPYFQEGGEGILLIPSALAYGVNGNSSIPPNTVLIFDVTLIDVI